MNRVVRQIAFFLVVAAVLGLGRNVVGPGRIAWVGEWGTVKAAAGDSTALPASADTDDPPFITLEQAVALHGDSNVIFLDARYPEDYEEGAIAGAVLLPFEMLDDYWPGVEPRLPKDRHIVTYCSGDECELSLFLARYLRGEGYEHLSIFYDGARLWEEKGMPMDTVQAPPPGAEMDQPEDRDDISA